MFIYQKNLSKYYVTYIIIIKTLLSAGCSPVVQGVYEEIAPIEAPALPERWCEAPAGDVSEGRWLVVFVSEPCASCRRLLQTLPDERVVVLVAHERSCADARVALRGHKRPFAPAGELERAWYVESTPTTYVVEDGIVLARWVGLP
jgi:hypothetical protein